MPTLTSDLFEASVMRRIRDKIRFGRGPIDVRPQDRPCDLWIGGTSLSGYRNVRYPIIRMRFADPPMRVTRLLLILKHGPKEVPRDAGEDFEIWLKRAKHVFAHLEAAHSCDVSLCVGLHHLKWQDHAKNIADQIRRRRKAVA